MKNLQVKLSGWFGGGLRHTFAEKAIPEEALGGKKGLSSLTAYLRDSGVGFFPDGDVQYTYTTGFGDGFTPKKDSVKLLNRAPGEVQAYNVATFQQDMALNLSKYIHNAAATDRALTGFVGVVDSYGITGLSLRNVGCRVNADYSEDTPTDRPGDVAGLRKSSGRSVREVYGDDKRSQRPAAAIFGLLFGCAVDLSRAGYYRRECTLPADGTGWVCAVYRKRPQSCGRSGGRITTDGFHRLWSALHSYRSELVRDT